MPKERMTPRERWLTVINRKVPDRVPLDYSATGEATKKLMKKQEKCSMCMTIL